MFYLEKRHRTPDYRASGSGDPAAGDSGREKAAVTRAPDVTVWHPFVKCLRRAYPPWGLHIIISAHSPRLAIDAPPGRSIGEVEGATRYVPLTTGPGQWPSFWRYILDFRDADADPRRFPEVAKYAMYGIPAPGLAEAGIASFRFDRRSADECTGERWVERPRGGWCHLGV